MKKISVFLVLAFFLSVNAFCQDKSEDLKTLFKLMQSEKMVDDMLNNMIPMLKQQASTQIKGENAQKKFEEYIIFMMEETKNLTKNLINDEMIHIYDKYFTQTEIKELIKFYQSPIGKKMIEKTPDISKDLLSSMITKHLPAFQEKLAKKIEDLNKQ